MELLERENKMINEIKNRAVKDEPKKSVLDDLYVCGETWEVYTTQEMVDMYCELMQNPKECIPDDMTFNKWLISDSFFHVGEEIAEYIRNIEEYRAIGDFHELANTINNWGTFFDMIIGSVTLDDLNEYMAKIWKEIIESEEK